MFRDHCTLAAMCNFEWLLAKFCRQFSLEQKLLREFLQVSEGASNSNNTNHRNIVFYDNQKEVREGRLFAKIAWFREIEEHPSAWVNVRELLSVIRNHLQAYNRNLCVVVSLNDIHAKSE